MTPAKKGAIISGLFFGLIIGGYFSFEYSLWHRAIAGVVSGALFGCGMYFLFTSKAGNG
jgi:hypothetical protein